jgi:hypothetical protein
MKERLEWSWSYNFFPLDDGASFIKSLLAGFVFSHLRFAYLQDLKKKKTQAGFKADLDEYGFTRPTL